MMISENYSDFLLPVLRKIYDKHIGKMKDFVPVLYTVEKSNKAQEFNHGIGSMGLMQKWNDSGGQVFYDTISELYKSTYTHEKFSIGLQIEKELLDDALYSEIKSKTREIANSVYYTRQHYAALPFNQCTTMIGPDGVALASASHPLGPDSSSTLSNYSTGMDLTADNVETVRNYMKAWTDDRGNKLLINPDMLIVPKELRKTAKIIADTDNEPFTTDYGVNIWKGALDVLEYDFLDSSTMWFMADSNRMKQSLKWFERRKPKLEKDGPDFDTEVMKYKSVCRFSYGWDDWSFIYAVSTV